MKIIQYIYKEKYFKEDGQATIELAVMFPVVIVIAVIAVNSILYFSYCAEFDRLFKQSVSILAPSPAYNKGAQDIRQEIEKNLKNQFSKDYLECDVSTEASTGGMYCFTAKLKMFPTLFGLGLKREVFGISLPCLSHQQKIYVDIYKPGVIF